MNHSIYHNTKKASILAVLILFCSALLMASTDNFKVLSQTSDKIEVKFELSGWNIETDTKGGIDYKTVKTTKDEYLYIDETPTLPVFSTMVAIPEGMDAQVSYESTDTQIISDFRLSSYAQIEREDSGSNLYPARNLVVSEPAQMRDFRVVSVNFYPFQVDSANRQMNVIKSGKITLRLVPSHDTYRNAGAGYYSTAFDNLYRAMIVNYNETRDEVTPIAKPVLLIIYPNTADATFLAKKDQLVAWKQQKGYTVNAVSTSVSGSTTTAIKSYITTQYNSIATRPDFVILVGDVDGSFIIPTYTISYYSATGDNQYSLVAGADQYSDVFLGRISINNTSEFSVYVSKVMAYEKTINVATAQWLNRMLLVSDTSSSGISTVYVNRFIHDISYAANPNYTYTENYMDNPSASASDTALNAGVGFFDFRGWIGMSGWSTTNINALTNYNKTPHAVIITCDTGTFESGTARTEALIRKGTDALPAGSVTAIGMSSSGTHTAFNNFLTQGIFDGIFNDNMRSMGEAQLFGKNTLMNVYGVSNIDMATNFQHLCNLMGDPSCEVYTTIPKTFITNVPATITTGTATLEFLIQDSNSIAVANAMVSLYQTTNCNVSGLTDANGRVILTIPTTLTGSLIFTVSKHDFKPTYSTIAISGGGIVFQSSNIDDDASGLSSGNSNGIINPSETIEYKATVRNTSATAITSASGTMTITDPYVTINANRLNFGTVAAGATALNGTAARFTISAGCPDNHPFTMYVSGNSSAGAWSFAVPLVVKAADLDYVSYSVTSGTNSVLDSGETANFTTTIKNNGTVGATAVYAILRSLDYAVSVVDSTAYLGAITSGTTYTNTSDQFSLFARSICLPGMTIPMSLYLYNAAGFSDTETFTLTIGSATLTDPLGQDAYGYYIYDNGDINYTECPTYQWVGIAPAEGGSGTMLAITDTGTSGTEGDTNTADCVDLVTLPFTFKFYGVDYTQITVCSNGFLAMGSTMNADFRNGRLPGPTGPNPMIAPFWDDLVTSTGGGIYKYYDSVQHRFIIEWYFMKNGDNNSSEETFQVILYDPAYFPTSTLDGPIKIQYKVFNNVDSGSSTSHGNYATVGIKNHTGNIGLEYSFNNQYPTAARTLTNNSALYITTKPIIPNTPLITLGQIIIEEPNGNGFVEPGESVNMGVRLSNAGTGIANNVSATLSESDPYITISHATSPYGTIAGMGSGMNSEYFVFTVAANCPADYIAAMQLTITATGGYSWIRIISIQVHKPTVILQSWLIEDISGNANGVLDPGESSWLVMNLQNEDNVAVQNMVLNIASNVANIVVGTPQITISTINGLKTYQAVTQVSVGALITNGTTVTFTLTGTSSNAATLSTTMISTVGVSNYSYNFETTNGGFTAVNTLTPGWEWGTSTYSGAHGGTKVWGCVLSGQYGNSATYELISPTTQIGSGANLTFWHRWALENSYDGGRVMISTDGGLNWAVITPTGNYPNSPQVFGGPGYGNSQLTWVQASFSLAAYASQSVKIKWQMVTDGSVVNNGWFVDDVVIANSSGIGSVGIAQGTVTLTPADPEIVHTVVAAGDTYTNPNAAGSYKLRLPAGTYAISGSLPSYTAATANATVAINATVSNVNLGLSYMYQPVAITYLVEGNQLSLRWALDSRPTFQHYNIYRKTGTDAWTQIAESLTPSYTTTITQNTFYEYRVTTQFDTGESVPSAVVDLVYPNNNTTIAPAVPQNVNVVRNGTQFNLSWQAVSTDISSNPITPWGYRIYAADTPGFTPGAANYLGTATTNTWSYTSAANKLFFKVQAILGYAN